nr:MAG TPA: hypothetical protein [Caudoviricetes sp.]
MCKVALSAGKWVAWASNIRSIGVGCGWRPIDA